MLVLYSLHTTQLHVYYIKCIWNAPINCFIDWLFPNTRKSDYSFREFWSTKTHYYGWTGGTVSHLPPLSPISQPTVFHLPPPFSNLPPNSVNFLPKLFFLPPSYLPAPTHTSSSSHPLISQSVFSSPSSHFSCPPAHYDMLRSLGESDLHYWLKRNCNYALTTLRGNLSIVSRLVLYRRFIVCIWFNYNEIGWLQ